MIEAIEALIKIIKMQQILIEDMLIPLSNIMNVENAARYKHDTEKIQELIKTL